MTPTEIESAKRRNDIDEKAFITFENYLNDPITGVNSAMLEGKTQEQIVRALIHTIAAAATEPKNAQ